MARDINDTLNRVRYTATLGQTVFTIPFAFDLSTDLKVWRNKALLGIGIDALVADYTVTGEGGTSGTLTLTVPSAPGDDILIVRDIPVARVGDFPINGPFDINSLNNQLDALTMMVQDIETRVDQRVLRLGVTDKPETIDNIPVLEDRRGRTLVFNEVSGNPEPGPSLAEITAASEAAIRARAAADEAASFAGYRDFESLSSLTANTTLTYAPGSNTTVVVGNVIRLRATGWAYQVVAANASYHIITAGGVCLIALPGANGFDVGAFGAVGDGVTDDTAKLVTAITYAASSKLALNWPGGNVYGFTNIYATVDDGVYNWVGTPRLKQLSTRVASTNAMQVGGKAIATTTLASSATTHAMSVTLTDASSVQVGDLIRLTTNRLMPGDNRNDPNNAFSQLVRVNGKSGNIVSFDDPLAFDFPVGVYVTGTAQAGTASTITLAAADTMTESSALGWLLAIISGANAGESRYIQSYNASTKVVGIGSQSNWTATPNNTSVYEIRRTVTATIYRPAKIISMPVNLTGYAESGVIVRGIQVLFCDSPVIDNADISGCSNNGLYTYNCYKATVSNCKIRGANYISTGGSGLGYGHCDIGCYATVAYGNTISNCRTCFDAVGGSLFLHRYGNTCIGGGKTYDGNDFWPIGSVDNYISSGLSSHTGSYGIVDDGNTLINIAFNKQRGLAQTFSNNIIKGAAVCGCEISYNDGLVCNNNVYQDGKTYRPSLYERGNNGFMSTSNDISYRPQCLVLIRHATMLPLSSVTVKGNYASAVTSSIVHLEAPVVAESMSLSVINNELDVISTTSQILSVIKADAGTVGLRDLVAYHNRIMVNGSNLGSDVSDNINMYPILDSLALNAVPSGQTITRRAVQTGPSQWLCILDDDTSAQIPVGVNNSVAEITVFERTYAVTNSYKGLVRGGSTTAIVEMHNSGCGFYTTVLTGTTGTDGQLNISLRSTDSRFILENRTGSAGMFVFNVQSVGT